MPLTCNMYERAAPVIFSPLSCTQCDGQERCASQLLLNNMLLCLDDLLLMHITSARLVTVSIHVNA